jgi:phage terminase large subunit
VATFLDYNADAEFWVHHLYAAEAKAGGNFCRSTYLDNPFISPAVVASIEAKRGNSEWWRVYGEGRTGKSEGVIYKRAESWHEFPDDVRRFGYGLDFGFSEPLALVKCGIAGEHIYAQEIAYQSGLTPSALAAALPTRCATILGDYEPYVKSKWAAKNSIFVTVNPKHLSTTYEHALRRCKKFQTGPRSNGRRQ